MDDILERLKASTKVNGAYPRDIADAINEIEYLREWQRLVFDTFPNLDPEDEVTSLLKLSEIDLYAHSSG